MKKIILIGIYAGAFGFLSKAQTPDLLWAQSNGSGGFEMVRDMIVDSDGNVISVGQFENTVDFDSGSGTYNLTSNGGSDMFIMKQDSDGNLLWAHNFGGFGADAAYGVGVDGTNNIYITGTFRYEVDFDPGVGDYTIGYWGTNAGQFFLLKLDEDGDLVFVNGIGNTDGSSQGLVMTVESSGLTVVSGTFNTTVDFDPSAGTANLTANTISNYDIFIASYTSDGGFGWAYSFGGGEYNNFPEDITQDASHNIILTGSFGGTADLDPTAGVQTAVGQTDDIFIMKLTSGGTFLWAKSLGSIWGDTGFAVITDSNDDVYLAAAFRQDIDLDPGAGTANYSIGSNENTCIIKFDWNGDFVWAKTFTGASNRPRNMNVDASDNLYITGTYANTTDFDPGPGTANSTSADSQDDIYIVKLDNTGLYEYSMTFGNTQQDRAENLIVTAEDKFYISGFFTDPLNLNPTGDAYTLNSNGSADNFIAKFGTCSIDLSVSTSGATLTANQPGATYQWMNCATFSTIAGATNQNFSPTSDGDYAVIITQGGCKDTSTCYPVAGVGIDEIASTKITAYPNPTNSNLTIETTDVINEISIYNVSGELVQTETTTTFSVENLPSGLYFINLKTQNRTVYTQFIKE